MGYNRHKTKSVRNQNLKHMFTKTPRKLDAILSSFASVVTELNRLQEYNEEVVAANEAKIQLAVERNNLLKKEAEQAGNVAQKINSLLS